MKAKSDPVRILCFGDSNTWGFIPAEEKRYAAAVRWPGILQKELGDRFSIIEEGLNGRTCVFADPISGDKNGLMQLPPLLSSHSPLDCIIIMLGTNDLKRRFGINAFEAAMGLEQVIRAVRTFPYPADYTAPEIIIAAPPRIVVHPQFSIIFDESSSRNSRDFAAAYKELAELYSCRFIDTALLVEPDPADGIHLSAEAHRVLGKAFADLIREIPDS